MELTISAFFTALWVVMLVAWLVAEFGAIWLGREFGEDGHVKARGTFSWHVWFLRSKWYLRGMAFAIWFWAGYHFFLEPDALINRAVDDIIIWVGLWVIGTLVVKPRKQIYKK